MRTKGPPKIDAAKQVLKQRDEIARLAKKTAVKPIIIKGMEWRSIIAYTTTDNRQPWVDDKMIAIPEGWVYWNHGVGETTGIGTREIKTYFTRDTRDSSRITEVHVSVEVFAPARAWCGAQLDVAIVPKAIAAKHARYRAERP